MTEARDRADGSERVVDPPTGPADTASPAENLDPAEPESPAAAPVRRPRWRPFSLFGSVTAAAFFFVSLTPSLLPRPWYLQAVASGVSLAVGYLVGVLLAWVYRSLGFAPPARRLRLVLWILAGVATVVLLPIVVTSAVGWEAEIHAMIGTAAESAWWYLPMVVVSAALALALLALARGARWVSRLIARLAGRWIPRPAAKALGVVMVLFAVLLLFTDTLVPMARNALNESFGLLDTSSPDGVTRPDTPLRSGGPGSLAPWDTLGYEGRTFVAGGPSVEQISDLNGSPAMPPIRVYAGLDTADTLEEAAEVVVAELQRTGAFNRSVLVVATTTGRGWVNPAAADAVEYLWGGDTAIAALQYSFLPSPVAFVADTRTPPLAGRILFRAVHEVWAELPQDDRPALYVMGESLGSFGSQGAFGSIEDLQARADGALWSGTPHFTDLWHEITADRDPGSPESVPVVENCAEVCFVDDRSTIPADADPSIVYVQHPTDAIVWWDPALIFTEPDWLAEGDRHGISRFMSWFPFVTFWQVTVDMALAGETPDGFGHRYGADLVDAWVLLSDPPGWTEADLAKLRAVIAG